MDRPPYGSLRARNATRGTLIAESLEVAESFGGRLIGLMGRAALPAGGGLWLRPASSIHMLFMRFPIDVIFLAKPEVGGGRRVVAVRAALRPWTGVVWWARGADGCLELPAGTAAASGTAVGDLVELPEVDAAGG
ncbi:MAG TPA: DUF192 domain-containing protein [Patescibacteria group bacterium]|nr:DUF192 domain-containing protein [Patescibacteria group bacterium]